MDFRQWLQHFRAAHLQARRGALRDSDLAAYLEGREQLAEALLAAQRISRPPNESARQALRVARALQLTLQLNEGPTRAMTLDLSEAGFSTMLAHAPDTTQSVGFQLRMPEGAEPLVGRAKVVASRRQGGSHRVSFVFEDLSDADRERMGFVVFDAALAQLAA